MLVVLLSGTIPTNCSSCKMYHHHILCSLFVCGLIAILLSGGLGVEDQPNDRCEARSCCMRCIYFFFFWGGGEIDKMGSLPPKPNNTQ
jgi:hypothetical protein